MPEKIKGVRSQYPFRVLGLRILIFAALITATALLLRPLQLSLMREMEKIRNEFISGAEKYLDCKIRYGSMGPSIFGALDIRNIVILREDDSVLLSISRLSLSYSLPVLLFGNFQEALHSVRIDRPVLNLDIKNDSYLVDRLAALGRKDASAPLSNEVKDLRGFLPENFTFRIRNGEWELTDPTGIFRIFGVRLDASVVESRVSFQGKWDASGTSAASSYLQAVMSGRVSGEYSDETEKGSATVFIPSFYGGVYRFKPITISCFLSDRRLEIRKTHDKSPSAISLFYDLDSGRLQGYLDVENFSPEELFVFSGPWKEYNPILACRVSGNATLEMENSNVIRYTMNLSSMLPDNTAIGPASLDINLNGNKENVLIDSVDVHSSYGDLNFRGGIDFADADSGSIAPYGSLSISNLHLQGNGGISGNLFINTSGNEITIFGEDFRAGNAVIPEINVMLYMEKEGINFVFSAHKLPDNQLAGGNVFFDGSLDYNPRHIQASLTLDSFMAGDILSFVEPMTSLKGNLLQSFADDLLLNTEVFFTTDYEHILYNAPRFSAVYDGMYKISAEASLSGTNTRFRLSEGVIAWENGSADISCSVDFSDPDDVSFSLGAVYKDLSYFFEGMFLDRKNLSILGSYGIQAFISEESSGAYSGYAQGDNIPLPSGDHYASMNFFSSLYYVSPYFWQAKIEKFEITNLATPAANNASLRFSGIADENGLKIPDIYFDDGKGPLKGNIGIDWDTSYSRFRFALDITGNAGSEYYSVNAAYGENKLDLNLSVLGMQLSRISSQNAVAEGSLALSWESFSSLEAEAVLSSLVFYRKDQEIRVSADASVNNDVLLVRQVKVNFSDLEATVPYFRISRTESIAETEARILGTVSGRPVNLFFRGNARFDPIAAWTDLLHGLGSFDGQVTFETALYDDIKADEPFSFIFAGLQHKDSFVFDVSGGPRNMARFFYDSSDSGGTFYAALSSPSPVRGSLSGLLNSKNIDAQGTDIYVDLSSLWRFIPPIDVIEFPHGIVTASVRIVGPVNDPEFFGTALGKSIHIVVPQYVAEPIRPVPTTITLSGSQMTFGPADAIVGQGQGKASGIFQFERWIPNTFTIDIHVPQETAIPYGFDISGVIAKGLASGRLIVAMEDNVLFLNGDLTANNTVITLNAAMIAALESGEINPYRDLKSDSVVDIYIRSGRRLEFLWPSAELPVLQANADMGTGVRITSDTASRRFSLTGDVKLRSGELFYLDRNFYLREGTLFFRENEADFDPRLSVRAEIRDQIDSGPVTISLIIDNAPLKSFTARFESSPPLSQLEIYSLLGQNPQGEPGSQGRMATAVVFDTLTQFGVIRRLQRQVRDFLGLDMFSARTQLLNNVVQQVASGGRQGPDDRPSGIGNYFDNSTVFMGKYLGADIFSQLFFTFKYDDNRTSWGGLKLGGGLILEPEFGLEMRNPLFDIRFNMIPLHPENLFISDVSFSLIWRRSF